MAWRMQPSLHPYIILKPDVILNKVTQVCHPVNFAN